MKRKWLAIGIILLFVGVTIAPAMAQVNEKFQSTTRGNWLYVGGSGPGNYTRIQDAIDNACDGDTVFVYDDSSPYYEKIFIDKSIHVLGENKNTTVIDDMPFGFLNKWNRKLCYSCKCPHINIYHLVEIIPVIVFNR